MSILDNIETLRIFGTIAPPAGIAIVTFYFIAIIIAKKNNYNSFHIVFWAGLVAIASIGSYTYVSTYSPQYREQPRHDEKLSTSPTLPTLTGDTGWIFAGYFNIKKEAFLDDGPYVSVRKKTTSGMRRFVEIGDTITLKVARDVHIVDFKKTGSSLKLVSPITKNIVDKNDKTGITLPAGTEVLVSDVSEGSWPGDPDTALWLRVIHTRK